MKSSKGSFYRFLVVLFVSTNSFYVAAAQNWQIAEGFTISFSSNGASGIFSNLKGNIFFDEQNLSTSRFDITIEVSSINTGDELQNKDAKSAEWFDAVKYPLIKYVTQKIVSTGSTYQSEGYLEMHGIKKMLVIPFSFQRTPKGAIFTATFTVNRSDFSIGKPGNDVAELIKIDLRVPVTRQQ